MDSDFSSPLPSKGRSKVVPASPAANKTSPQQGSNSKQGSYYINIFDSGSDSDDELAAGRRGGESSHFFTQPTQIVNRPTLGPATTTSAFPSSPSSTVEVPASSPYRSVNASTRPALPQARSIPAGGRLASLMAPAGTAFRAPQVTAPKRMAIEISSDDDEIEEARYTIQDSSEDEKPARGDIRPASFERRKTETSHTGTKTASVQSIKSVDQEPKYHPLTLARATQLARLVYKNLDGMYSMDACKDALLKTNNIATDAAEYLLKSQPSSPDAITIAQTTVTKPTTTNHGGRLLQKGSTPQIRGSHSLSSSAHSSPAKTPASSALSSQTSQTVISPSPKAQKPRRLIRGLKPRSGPSSSQPEVQAENVKTLTSHQRVIDLVSDGEEDQYVEETSSPEVRQDIGSRALTYLETCSTESLIAMCKVKKDVAEVMIKHRPYRTLRDARNVSCLRKSGRGKRSKTNVGDDVVDCLLEYIQTLDAIDEIVGQCDAKGSAMNAVLNSWKVNKAGRDKRAGLEDGADAAIVGKLVDLPCSSEPRRMRGKCTLQPYQLFGVNWLWELYRQRFGCILADDMGLGKTCQIIAFVCHLIDQFERGVIKAKPWPILIVVPPSTLANWEIEFDKFSQDVSLIVYSGSQAERDELALDIHESPESYHVILTSYTQLSREEDIDAMRAIRPHCAVFDEGHKMKNPKAKIYNELFRIHADWKVLLTGTPVQNNIMEMVALLQFINPKLFANYMDVVKDLFEQRVSLQEVSQGAVLHSDRVDRARSILEPFILQRKKEHVLSTLPAKTRRVEHCELYEDQAVIYKAYEQNFRRGKEPRVRTDGRTNDQNNVWMQLRKAAIHAQLFRRFFTDSKVEKMARLLMDRVPQDELRQPNLTHLENELKNCSDFELHLWCRDYPFLKQFDCPKNSWLHSGKVKKLLELLDQFKESGDRVLVFSRFAMVITILEECLASAGINYRVLQGDTAVSERQELIDQFNEDTSIPVFLLTTGAGGTGINLTAANKVVIFDQSDNPQDDIQAENRAHRLGQQREVEVIRLLSKDTVEELVHKACQKKLELAGKITGYAEDITAKDIENEVRSMMSKQQTITPPKSDFDSD